MIPFEISNLANILAGSFYDHGYSAWCGKYTRRFLPKPIFYEAFIMWRRGNDFPDTEIITVCFSQIDDLHVESAL